MAIYPSFQEGARDADQRRLRAIGIPFVGLAPMKDGFVGMLLEIYRNGDRYVLLEVAPATGNRLLQSSSKDRGMISAILAGKLGGLFDSEVPLKGLSW
jgi:hypothetical protein